MTLSEILKYFVLSDFSAFLFTKMSALLRFKSKWRLPSSTSRPIRFESSNAAPAQLRLPASWRLLDSRRVPEFDIDAVVLEHCRTRAQYLHMGAADANNAFSVSFRQALQLMAYNSIAPVGMQCCGSGMFIPDSNFFIPDSGCFLLDVLHSCLSFGAHKLSHIRIVLWFFSRGSPCFHLCKVGGGASLKLVSVFGCKNTGVLNDVCYGRKKLALIVANQGTLWFISLNITFGTSSHIPFF